MFSQSIIIFNPFFDVGLAGFSKLHLLLIQPTFALVTRGMFENSVFMLVQ